MGSLHVARHGRRRPSLRAPPPSSSGAAAVILRRAATAHRAARRRGPRSGCRGPSRHASAASSCGTATLCVARRPLFAPCGPSPSSAQRARAGRHCLVRSRPVPELHPVRFTYVTLPSDTPPSWSTEE
ncbi:hypothetical protein BRADI_1g59735v3 [Brachypodium distachyon]|uniref:Uncharacterized protein n=1 Tax=Brachypodium distachyon TaxID=15368 RepID=A0A0Q3LE63_BRADI|nr:hypothetical protein BRADI_1g59735v3 [Brachypodium distachyon]